MVRRVLLRLSRTSPPGLLRLCVVAALCLGVASVLPGAASAAEYGPVAEYSFDEGAGTTVEDLAGESDGTVEGATWRPGRYGQGLSFEGKDDCVSVPNSESLQLHEEFTIEAWVKPEGSSEEEPIIFKEVEGEPDYVLGIGITEAGRPEGWAEGESIAAPKALEKNVWTHLAYTYDGDQMRFYVDGAIVAEKVVGNETFESDGPLRIGCWPGHEYFEGALDEVRIYDRVLSGADVAADMEAPIQTPRGGPVAEWSFDEGAESGGTVEDLAGENDGTLEGAERGLGRYGEGLTFDGEEDCVSVPNSASLHLAEEFTLEAWVRPTSPLQADPIIYKEAGGDFSYALGIGFTQTGHLEGWAEDETEEQAHVVATGSLEPGVWSHVAYTYDGDHMRLYVDGTLVGDDAVGAGITLEGEDPLWIGCSPNGHEYFGGRIDEPRVYERALSATEVAGDMETPIQTPKQGPIAAYSFDEGEEGGETVQDVTGDGHTATIEDGVRGKGRYGGGIEFDGQGGDTCVSVPDSPELRLSEEFTLEAWARPLSGVYEDPLVVREAGGKDAFGLGLGSRVENTVEGFIGQGKGSRAAVGGEVRENEWTPEAVTYDGATLRVYEEGVLVAEETATTPPMTGEGPLKIGCDGPDGQFTGGIDEVRVYNRALNVGEVAGTMEAPLQTPKATAVASYSFDENNEETQADTSGDGHTATVEGAKWTEHGRYGGAMEFDAAEEDVLKIPASPELNFTEAFTLEAWVRPSGEDNHSAPLIDKQEGSGLGYFLYEGGSVSDQPVGAASEEQEYVHADDPLPAHAWSHVALVFTGGRTYLIVDGEVIANGAAEPVVTEEGELEIGGSSDRSDYFDGRIDEVRIYNRPLNLAELATDMEAPIQTPKQGPIAAWSFDEVGQGGTVEDLTGDGHTATVEGATAARGKYGEALQFDGENDVVKVPNSPEFALTEGFTLESWVRPESESDEWAPILAKAIGGGEAAYELAWWLYESGHEPNVPFGGTESAPGEKNEALGEDPLPVGTWSHLALTYDGSQVVLYVNGELVDCSEAPSDPPRVTEGELQIGAATENGDYFKGRIDEVRIYNRALSQPEIVQSMSTTFPVAVTEATEEVGSNDAILTGTTQVRGAGTEYFFEYGASTEYDSVASGEEVEGNGEKGTVEAVAVSLAPETLYHYRVVAEGPLGIVRGKDQTFTTGERTMIVEEEEAEKAAEEAILNGEEPVLSEEEGEFAPALAVPSTVVPRKEFFGAMWTGTPQEMAANGDFKAIKDSGAKVYRFCVAEGTQFEESFNQAKNHGLTALPFLGEGAFPDKPGVQKHFIEFAEGVVNKFGPSSSYGIETWEIWNEPNMPFGTAHPAHEQGEVKPVEFAQFYTQLVRALREKHSKIKIIAPALFGYKHTGRNADGRLHMSPRDFLKLFNAKLKNEELNNPYEGLSLHPYIFKTRTPANTGLHTPTDKPDANQVMREVKGEIEGLKGSNEGNKIWITELGFPVESLESNGQPDTAIPSVSTEEQARLVTANFWMLFRARKRLGIQSAIYYNIQDIPGTNAWDHHSGLLELSAKGHPGNPRESYNALAHLAGGSTCSAAPC